MTVVVALHSWYNQFVHTTNLLLKACASALVLGSGLLTAQTVSPTVIASGLANSVQSDPEPAWKSVGFRGRY